MDNFRLFRYLQTLRLVGYGQGRQAVVVLPSTDDPRPRPGETPFEFWGRQRKVGAQQQK